MMKQWQGFQLGKWTETIDVRDFIQKNYTMYDGDKSFLAATTAKTKNLWDKAEALIIEEIKKGVMDVEANEFSGINNFKPGYLDKENEVIVGYQTDAPLKRIMNPFGGMRMVEQSLEEYGFKMDEELNKNFKKYRKTHTKEFSMLIQKQQEKLEQLVF